jgi:carbonic anhydrase/acetyltransferase-like protein (isoleucine patch superfamily)
VALPSSTFDHSIADGMAEIPIEERSGDEVLLMEGIAKDGNEHCVRISAPGTAAANPAFDITPARLITGLITEYGILPATEDGLPSIARDAAVLRAEFEPIEIGAGTNIQDGAVVHVDPGFPATIGAGVSVGHNAVLHGCTVEDGSLVGMGSTVLNGAVIGAGSLVAAGALVPQGAVIPPRSLVAGVPAKVRRELSDDEVAGNKLNSEVYVQLSDLHRNAVD